MTLRRCDMGSPRGSGAAGSRDRGAAQFAAIGMPARRKQLLARGRGGDLALASGDSAWLWSRVIRFFGGRGMHSMNGKSRLFGALVMGVLSGGVAAQGRTLGTGDYARAERFMSYNTVPLVDHAVTKISWLDDSHFWYVDHDTGGDHFVRMDAASGRVTPLFDQVRLAAALGKASGKPVDARKLPVTGYAAKPDGRVDIAVRSKHYLCDLAAAPASCVDRASLVKSGKESGTLSPDKKSETFIRDWNLWLRDVASGKETQLTTDGV